MGAGLATTQLRESLRKSTTRIIGNSKPIMETRAARGSLKVVIGNAEVNLDLK